MTQFMTQKSKFKITMMALFSCLVMTAQERYRVTYDYNSEKIGYYKLDKNNKVSDTLDAPRIKRNSLVEIQLQNVNPFAADVVTDVKEESLLSAGQGFNFSSLLGGLNSFTDNKIDINTPNLPATSAFTSSDGSRGAVTNNYSELNNTITNIAAIKNSLMSNLLNPNLDKETIINNLMEAATADEDVRLPDPQENFYRYLAQLEKTLQEDKSALEAEINTLADEVESIGDSAQVMSRGELVARNIAARDLQRLITNLQSSTDQSVQNIAELNSLYTILEAAAFEQTYDYELEADKVNIELKFVQSDFSADQDRDNQQTTLKTRNIKLFSKGGFKINTSVALTLNNFGDKSKDFFVDESGVIGADDNDYFVPNLSTMINFYPFMGESFNMGGSFGISIPISGDENINGINFLLGPSMFFGNKSRLSVSGGLAYGPVKKLTNGFEVGDTTSFGSVDNFTKSVYEFGYYFGISFSLFDIN